VQRAIPPDLAHAAGPGHAGSGQHEAIGDLHLAADNFSGAIEEYREALKAVGSDAPAERSRLLLRLAEVHTARGEYEPALAALHEARDATRA